MEKIKASATTEAFERAPAGACKQQYVLQLFVAGATAMSAKAIANTKQLCEDHLAGRHELHIVDTYQQPELARRAQVIALPTLIRLWPLPLKRIIGDMADAQRILLLTDTTPSTATPEGKQS